MPVRRSPSRKSPTRRGSVALEMLFMIPLFMLAAIGMIGLADLLITEQVIVDASGRGARTAALGGSEEQVKETVKAVLGADRAANAKVLVGPAEEGGEWPVPPGGLIEVRVEITAGNATATGLAPLGSDELLVGRTVVQRE